MIEEIDEKGFFWLPEKPEIKIPGTFSSSPASGGSKLELFHPIELLSDEPIISDRPYKFDVILGHFLNGYEITLVNCIETAEFKNYSVDKVFLGYHFKDKSEIKFRKVRFSLTFLNTWMNKSVFSFKKISENSSQIEFVKPSPVSITSYKNIKVFLDTGVHESYQSLNPSVKLDQQAFFTLESEQDLIIDEYLEMLYFIRSFFCFVLTEPIYPLVMNGVLINKEKENSQNPSRNTIVPIILKTVGYPDKSKQPQPSIFYFTFRDIEKNLGTYFSNWFTNFEKLKSAIDLYFSAVHSLYKYPIDIFLSFVQVLEIYHRCSYRNSIMTKHEHKLRIKNIINTAPSDYQIWLKDKLAYSNEPSLKNRIKDLLSVNHTILSEFIPDEDTFIKKVVDTRNFNVHYDPRLKSKSLTGKELYNLGQKLKVLCELCFLREIGFTDDLLIQFTTRNYRFHKILKDLAN
ncbi:MAG: hypothetical protein PHW04_10760 [Candidatus Wallbacteria bacterium]|nr:hypothetical protein [Candidatus Wallbacteria bacterium]